MKKFRLLSMFLAVCMVFSTSTFAISPEAIDYPDNSNVNSSEVKIIQSYSSADDNRTIFMLGDTPFYLEMNSQYTFCSQLSPSGFIHYSCVTSESPDELITGVYQGEEITSYGTSGNILSNQKIELFQNANHDIINDRLNKTYSDVISYAAPKAGIDLDEKMEEEFEEISEHFFGAPYTSELIGSSLKWNGNEPVSVELYESQSNIIKGTDLNAVYILKDTAVDTGLALLFAGWPGSIALLAKEAAMTAFLDVISTVLKDGIVVFLKSFTAVRRELKVVVTKNARIEGTPWYNANYTRCAYFLYGDLGWNKSDYMHGVFKHDDFDDDLYLMDKAFQNYAQYG